MNIDLTDLDEVNALLDRAIAEKGADYVYDEELRQNDECKYFENGIPSCIVGHVLAYKGATADQLEDYEGKRVSALGSDSFVVFSGTTEDLLAAAQFEQDEGIPWGEAVEVARRSITD